METKGVFFILLIIGIAACLTSSKCPPRENMGGCKCFVASTKTLRISCWGDGTGKTIQDYRKIFQDNNLSRERNIILSWDNFHEKSSIPSRMFEGYHISYLDFYGNNVSKWADEEGGPAFVGLEDTLETLAFDRTINTGSKAPMSLSHLRKLRVVTFYNNPIYTFHNGWFEQGPRSLEILKLLVCKIRSIGDRAFAALTNLKVISLSSNEIGSLSRSMFPNPANHLEEINLPNNKLETLPDDMFTNMPALAEVNLHRNSITRLPENLWQPVWSSLRHLTLLGNELKCDGSIDWIFKVRPPKRLIAFCYDDKHRMREDLELLIKAKQKES